MTAVRSQVDGHSSAQNKTQEDGHKRVNINDSLADLLAKEKGYCIALQREGVPANDSSDHRETGPFPFDNQNSDLFSTCDYHVFVNGKAEAKKSLISSDKMIIGYTAQGLPFQLIVSGVNCEDDHRNQKGRTELFNFVQNQLLPLVPLTVRRLTKSKDAKVVMEKLVADIAALREQHLSLIQFNYSIAISFEQHDINYVAGVSLGSGTGLLYIHPTEGQQLAPELNVIKVDNQGVLFGYLSLSHDLLMDGKYRLHSDMLDEDSHQVHYQIRKKHLGHMQRERLAALEDHRDFYSHSMMGVVGMPVPELQHFLQEYIQLDSILTLFGSFLLPDPSEAQALTVEQKNLYQHLIDHGNDLLNRIYTLKCDADSENLVELTETLRFVNNALVNPSDRSIQQLKERANQLQGSPSPLLKGVGIALMALGGVIVLLGAALMIASVFATTAILFAPLGVPAFQLGTGMLIGGGVLFTAGISFFAGGQHRAGLSQTVNEMAKLNGQNSFISLIP